MEGDWAQTMQIHPEGSADLGRHCPNQFDHATRWICCSQDEDAIGIEPCTAELEGFSTEKKTKESSDIFLGARNLQQN